MVQLRLLFTLFFLLFFSVQPYSSESNESPLSSDYLSMSSTLVSTNTPLISPTMVPASSPPPSSDRTVAKAIGATAVTTLVVAGILFVFFQKCRTRYRRKNKIDSGPSFRREEIVVAAKEEFDQPGGAVKGLIVDDSESDILYLRKLESGRFGSNFSTIWIDPNEEKKRMDIKEDRLRKHDDIHNNPLFYKPSKVSPSEEMAVPLSLITSPSASVPVPPSLPMAPPPSPVVPMKKILAPPLPLAKKIPAPPPPPPIPAKKIPPPPPPPPMLPKRSPAPPPPPPKARSLTSSLKPPPVPRRRPNSNSKAEEPIEDSSLRGTDVGQTKLKPLHWDKVTANVDHSLVWDEINDGSFRFDDDLVETLFGYAANNQKSPETNYIPLSSSSSNSAVPAQIVILEPRKSQNIAIVLKSLAVSRKEILDALLDGQGLSTDALEKLSRISPSPDEESKIVQFHGNPSRLADAESFLYHILKAVPSAFTRFNAMLFRSIYDPEILHLKESLQTLELGCKELRTRGIFLKLLEAILKAGNRMNAGTARGNAQGFNLNALRKISDVKSTDGKTTLLHFVVEQVVRSEGRRCVVNRDYTLGRSNSQRTKNSDPNQDSPTSKEERDREYLRLGLPVLGSLSVEFSNVKKAATIDYDSFITASSSLTARVAEIQQLVTRCGNGERGGFVKEMKGFLEECEEELKVVREEQTRVMELVKKTTEYYQAGSSKDKPLQLFAIVKDFLDKVDQASIDITRKLQSKNITRSRASLPPLSPLARNSATFPNWQSNFMPDKSRTRSSSDSEDDF